MRAGTNCFFHHYISSSLLGRARQRGPPGLERAAGSGAGRRVRSLRDGQRRGGAPGRAPAQPGLARGALAASSDPVFLYGYRESVVNALPPVGVTQSVGGGGLVSPGVLAGVQVKTSYEKL